LQHAGQGERSAEKYPGKFFRGKKIIDPMKCVFFIIQQQVFNRSTKLRSNRALFLIKGYAKTSTKRNKIIDNQSVMAMATYVS